MTKGMEGLISTILVIIGLILIVVMYGDVEMQEGRDKNG